MMSEDTKAIKDHGRLLLYRKEEKVASQPISRISSVVVTKQAHVTMPLVYALLEEGVPISYMDFRGRVLGVLGGERISLEHLFRQKEVFESPKEQVRLVRETVCRKIKSQRKVLKEYSYYERELQSMAAIGRLAACAHKAKHLMDIEVLRGMEGAASRVYFSAFPCLLDEKIWHWEGRAQHPAHDAVNACSLARGEVSGRQGVPHPIQCVSL
jgi:CRISPR-associated endonuclease Cas1